MKQTCKVEEGWDDGKHAGLRARVSKRFCLRYLKKTENEGTGIYIFLLSCGLRVIIGDLYILFQRLQLRLKAKRAEVGRIVLLSIPISKRCFKFQENAGTNVSLDAISALRFRLSALQKVETYISVV